MKGKGQAKQAIEGVRSTGSGIPLSHFALHLFVTKRILSSIFQPAKVVFVLAGWKIEERILLVPVEKGKVMVVLCFIMKNYDWHRICP